MEYLPGLVVFCILTASSLSHSATPPHLSPLSRQRTRPCGQFCRFRLCDFDGQVILRRKADFTILLGPLSTSLPFICLRRTVIGRILSTGEAQIFDNDTFLNISRFSPPGLDSRFRRRFLITKPISLLPWSGLATQRVRGNQWDFLQNRCFILPILSHQQLDPETRQPVAVVNTRRRRSDCVAFRTSAPALVVQLTWASGDNLDLSILEPGGFRIDSNNTRSMAGGMLRNSNGGVCDAGLEYSRELITYPAGPVPLGEYTTRIRNEEKCAPRGVPFRFVIVRNGRPQRTSMGTATRRGFSPGVRRDIETTFPVS